ncbi:MAG: fructose-6-phosphate aldolase [Deltaproteobacteria bacterium]|nr:fructose-6-phosphate aldolase [Deltaproteobacteria bacterium]MBI3293696.1 fructose-6-phosphate aldolase [Deltaproteobacteria bacterium]
MKIFIDSADLEEIKAANSLGLLDGVTTNPTLIAKSGKAFAEVARSITALVKGPVSLEVTSIQWEGMLAEAHALRKHGDNVVVKIPMTADGLKAVKALSAEKIPTNVTLIFQPVQALLAAKAGATYVSPFIGRHDDIAQDGMLLVKDIVTMFRNYAVKTQVLVASVRHPIHVIESAKLGADVVTLPLKVIHQLIRHPLTDAGLKTFLADWEKVSNKSLT